MRLPGLGVLVLIGIVAFAVPSLSDREPGKGSDEVTHTRTVITRVVDGDTVVTRAGQHLRIIGVDTPEQGRCGYDAATRALRELVEGRRVALVDPASVVDRDSYGRLLRFVEVGGVDVGLAQLRAGLAVARYDSSDGYDPHPREDRYRTADRRTADLCR